MRETRKRGIPATEEGRQKLTTAKAAKRNDKDKVWTYLDIATAAEVNETTVKRFFRGDAVDKESAISICKALDLEVTDIVDPKDLNPPTPTTTPTEINWREICTKVLATQQLRRQATAQQYELKIYVPLGLMERPKTPNPRKNATGEDSPPQKEPELQIVQTYKDDAFFLKVIAENHTEKRKHIAIIGEPGAGKTTLLGELADRLCRGGFVDNPCHPQTAEINPPFPSDTPYQPQTNKGGFLTDTSCHPQKSGINPPLHSYNENFPICIRLADLRSSTIADYLLNNWLSKALQFIDFEAENVTPEIRKEFKQLFAAGKVWLLLDGVDEMAATSPIEALARIREQLTDWVGKARVVLTCRLNVWDAAISNTLTDFDTYKTLEFEPDDVDEFIRKWFEEASQDEKRRNSGNETFWREQGKRLTRQLKEPGKERIKELVRNPLRLSMLCQSWCVPEQELPETKAALYEQFTTYFFEWKQEEFEQKQRVLKQRDKKQIQQALAKLALAAMESVNRFRIEQDFAIEQMEEEWFNLADELGWLVLVDRDSRTKKPVYAFFHPTFQEYFAACAIEDWHYFLNHQIPPVSDCSYRIFERQWREVILLWLGRGEIEGKQKEEFIDALVNFEDGCGEWGNQDRVDKGFYEYRAYFLATDGIAEFQDYSQIDEVIQQIVRWGFGYFDTVIRNAAKETLQQTQRPKVIDSLTQLLNCSQLHDFTRWKVAEGLGNIDPGNQNAIDTLVQLVSSDQLDEDTRDEVVHNLGNIDQGNQKAINALVRLLSSDQLDEDTLWVVLQSLENISQGNQKAINALVQLLSSDLFNNETCGQVAYSLWKIGQGNQKALDALVQLLGSDQLDEGTRWQVAVSLGITDSGNQKLLDALVQLLITPLVQLLSSPQLDNKTRRQVVVSLENIGQGNQKVIDALVQLLSSDQLDEDTCRQVVVSLGNIGQGNQKTLNALVQLLSSRQLDEDTHRQVAESLWNIDPGNQKAIDALLQLLGSNQLNEGICRLVVDILGKVGQGNQKVLDALVQLLSVDQLDEDTRWQVAVSLWNVDPGNQKALDALLQLLSVDQLDDGIRWQVAVSLGNIDPGNQKALDALVQLLSSDQFDDGIRWQVAVSLWNIGQGNQIAINALAQLLSSDQLDNSDFFNYDSWFYSPKEKVIENLEEIQTEKQLAVITILKANFNNSQKIDYYCYELIWHYAQNLPYPDFYQAWHQDTLTNTTTANLNIAKFPRYLAEAINNQPELCSKVKLICIDTHQIIDPENPAPEIYDLMLNQNCPEWQNGYPETMQKLKLYWNNLRRNSENPLFFICYDSTALTATPTGFSDTFLKALSKFDGAICVVTSPPNPLSATERGS